MTGLSRVWVCMYEYTCVRVSGGLGRCSYRNVSASHHSIATGREKAETLTRVC